MVYHVTYHTKGDVKKPTTKFGTLILVEGEEDAPLEKILAVVKKVSGDDVAPDSVEVLKQPDADAEKIRAAGLKVYRLG